MSSLAPQAQTLHVHHPDYYFPDGSAIFRLLSSETQPAGLLYNLHTGLLARRSTFFNSLFSLPRHPNSPDKILSEGKSDNNPIELPSCIEQADFDSLLIYLYEGSVNFPDTDKFLISVMKMSALFDIADGTAFATKEFTARGDNLHPALQFELARSFRIDSWIGAAFRRLMKMSLALLTAEHVAQIGLSGYYWLTHTKAEIQELRTGLAFEVPPIVIDDVCRTPDACEVAWIKEWRERVRQLINHPEDPITLVDLLDQLRNVHIQDLCDACQDRTVTWLWGTGLFTKEGRLVDDAVVALMELQTHGPLRVALNSDADHESTHLVLVESEVPA